MDSADNHMVDSSELPIASLICSETQKQQWMWILPKPRKQLIWNFSGNS